MRGTSSEENPWTKDAYELLTAIHGDRVCSYRAGKGSFPDPLFKGVVQTCGQHIRYCGVRSNHQNAIVERRIKKLTLGIQNLLLHATRLWIEAVSTMLWTLSSKTACHRYNSMDMDEDRKTPEQKFSGVEFQNFPTVYDTWGF